MRYAIYLFIHLKIIFEQNLLNILRNAMTLLFTQGINISCKNGNAWDFLAVFDEMDK